MKNQGVTSLEIKSGYGLDLENELKMLRVARLLASKTNLRIKTTFLGAHALPPEYEGRSLDYIHYLCKEVIPNAVEEQLIDAIDVFCDEIGFNLIESEKLFNTAVRFNIPVKCHAEQLSNIGASKLASSFNALSCDHLEYLDEEGADALKKSNTVAVLLPGAFYFLKEQRKPPVELLRQKGIGMAVATDCNPGSSPTASLPLMMHMACHFFQLTPAEVLSGVTYQASRALQINDLVGEIKQGYQADLVQWETETATPAFFCYQFGTNLPHKTMIAGKWLSS